VGDRRRVLKPERVVAARSCPLDMRGHHEHRPTRLNLGCPRGLEPSTSRATTWERPLWSRSSATIEWLIDGVPQMSPPSLVEALDRPIALRLTGAGGDDWTLRAGAGTRVDLVEGTSGDEAATITSPAIEFVIWATHRRPWQDRDVAVEGDTEAAARVLDAIHVF
jgi:MDMPI C-terminal domain